MKRLVIIPLMLGALAFGSSALAEAKAVDVNTATAQELATLKGIGQKTAQHIIEWREKNGAFTSIEELASVKGINKNTLERIKEKNPDQELVANKKS